MPGALRCLNPSCPYIFPSDARGAGDVICPRCRKVCRFGPPPAPRRRGERMVMWSIVVAIGLLVVPPCLFIPFYFATTGGHGSVKEADRLKAVIEQIPRPEAGPVADEEYAFKRFENGEWVMGIGRDSHALMSMYRGGGTLVVRDSRGQVRCFFGHVCGRRGLAMYLHEAETLDEFYKGLVEGPFTEWQWP